MAMPCMKNPCPTCPYRRDVPSGIWDESEYAKLELYDEPTDRRLPQTALFLCHTTPESPCRGWLTVHREAVAVRRAMFRGEGRMDDVHAEPPVALFESGAKASAHGRRDIDKPSEAAIDAVTKVLRIVRTRTKSAVGAKR